MKKAVLIIGLLIVILAGFFYLSPKSQKHASQVTVQKSEDGYRLLVDKKPFVVRGVCYSPIPIGKDYEYNFWGDESKPWIADGKLMKEMGVNTVRFYRMGKNPDEVRAVLDDLYYQYGIYSLVGTYLGFWNWPPPNYTDEEFREKVKLETIEMVKAYKDNPGVLMWVLGNENNYSFDRNVQRWTNDELDAITDPEQLRRAKAKIYYSYVNDIAREIKKIDPSRPVAMGVGEVASLDAANEYAPDIDIIGMIAYRGPEFGNLFRAIKDKFNRPVVMTEFGADSFNADTREPDEENQADFLKRQWNDISRNLAGQKGAGNVLGGTIFEWSDEWWKGNENVPNTWAIQDQAGHWKNASYYHDASGADPLNMNEEWWGVVALDPKKKTKKFYERVPKEAYSVLKELWTKQE